MPIHAMRHVLLGVVLALVLGLPVHAQEEPPEEPIHLQVGTYALTPFVIKQDDALTGFAIDLWEALAQSADIEYDIVEFESANALFNAVSGGRVDIGVGGISVTSDEETMLDFSYPILNSGLQILVRKSETLGLFNIFSALASPRLLEVLAILAGVIIIAGHVVWLAERHINPDFEKGYLQGVWEGIWWASATIVAVGYGDRTPHGRVGRGFAIVLMFTGVALIAHFTAVVTTNFTLQELRGDITSVNDLYGKSVVTIDGTRAQEYLDSINLEAFAAESIEQAYNMLENERVDAVIYDAPVLMYYAATEGRGKVNLAGRIFVRNDYGFIFAPENPYKEPVNRAILRLIEDGTYQDIYNRWFEEETR
ncbi:MAG: transporter substrate-binding domain-containing protein [Anaerolineae bacterium]|nr:transporter substrate-binding domain-containing protein [Anaerolineae bacterium]